MWWLRAMKEQEEKLSSLLNTGLVTDMVSCLFNFFWSSKIQASWDSRGREVDFFLIRGVVCSYREGRNCWHPSLFRFIVHEGLQ